MEPIFIDYPHRAGGSCIASVLGGMFAHAGFDFTEEEIFGLGAGLCFSYGGSPATRAFTLELFATRLELTLFTTTGVLFRQRYASDPRAAWDRLVELLREGRPVPVRLNPAYCPDMPAELLPFTLSHWVVVCGYDPATDEVHFHDNRRFAAFRLPRERFMEGRCTGGALQNPQNLWIEAEFPEALVPRETSFRLALMHTVADFKYFRSQTETGEYARMAKFQRHFKLWKTILTEEQIRENALRMMTSITATNTVRGGFRLQYARFVERAAGVLDEPELREVAALYRRLGRSWKALHHEFARMAAEPLSPAIWSAGSAYFNLLDEIVAGEREAVDRIERVLDARDAARPAPAADSRPLAAEAP